MPRAERRSGARAKVREWQSHPVRSGWRAVRARGEPPPPQRSRSRGLWGGDSLIFQLHRGIRARRDYQVLLPASPLVPSRRSVPVAWRNAREYTCEKIGRGRVRCTRTPMRRGKILRFEKARVGILALGFVAAFAAPPPCVAQSPAPARQGASANRSAAPSALPKPCLLPEHASEQLASLLE